MQTINSFQFASSPEIHFGWGIRQQLLKELKQLHKPCVLIASPSQMKPDGFGEQLLLALPDGSLSFQVSGEPSPDLVDEIVQQCPDDITTVFGLGGGSVLDCAKAVAGLIPSQTSVMDYLEGVGLGKPFHVKTCDFIAIPTTAGTGSETTKNAVLSRIGQFKKSFRDNKLLAKQAWLDPQLLVSCPKDVLYATGMDAFTQLLESYTTVKSNPMTDALAMQGMKLFHGAFEAIDSNDQQRQQQGYGNLMLAASLSGLTLANSGLGAVHGLAGPIGAFFKAPHGIVCARLLAPITKANIQQLQQSDNKSSHYFLQKYQDIASLLTGNNTDKENGDSLAELIAKLQQLVERYAPQGLAVYGLRLDNIQPVIDNCRSGSMLGNPLTLDDDSLVQAIQQAL